MLLQWSVSRYLTQQQRIVIKQQPIDNSQWHEVTRWERKDRQWPPKERVPLEASIQKRLSSGLPNEDYIAPYLGHSLNKKFKSWNLYCAWARYGDLLHLIWEQRRETTLLPEFFIWYIFRAMVKSALCMERGPKSWKPAKGKKWVPIVHCDIKSTNLLLGDFDPAKKLNRYDWPMPWTTDFGLAVELSDMYENPGDFIYGAGTEGYRPPEQHNKWGKDGFEFSAASNVFQVGMVVYELMNYQVVLEKTPAAGKKRRGGMGEEGEQPEMEEEEEEAEEWHADDLHLWEETDISMIEMNKKNIGAGNTRSAYRTWSVDASRRCPRTAGLLMSSTGRSRRVTLKLVATILMRGGGRSITIWTEQAGWMSGSAFRKLG